jgi:hypothetical protein
MPGGPRLYCRRNRAGPARARDESYERVLPEPSYRCDYGLAVLTADRYTERWGWVAFQTGGDLRLQPPSTGMFAAGAASMAS